MQDKSTSHPDECQPRCLVCDYQPGQGKLVSVPGPGRWRVYLCDGCERARKEYSHAI